MTKKYCPLFCIILLMSNCTPRYNNARDTSSELYKAKYADQLDEGSTWVNAFYHYTTEKTAKGAFVFKIYYPDTRQITSYDTYSDASLKIKNGLSKSWSDDGMLTSEGHYKNNNKVGEWKSYHKPSLGTNTTTVGNYIDGQQEGVWTTRDSLGNLLSEYSYQAGKRHGPFKTLDPEGELLEEGSYKNDEVEWKKTHKSRGHVNSENDMELFKVVEKQPLFPGCIALDSAALKKCSDEKMLTYIYSTIRYPAKARQHGIEGMAIVTFVVEKDGSVNNVKSVRGLCNEIRDEVIRVVRGMPNWVPGEQNGKPVRVQFTLPVRFKLE